MALCCQVAVGDAVRDAVRQGNALYADGAFAEAIEQYDQALAENPKASEARFNKATCYYRLDDLAKAVELYKQVAVESRDMELVARARYNLGNSHFRMGARQRDADLQKAVDELKTAISHWRTVLDIEPENEKAAKNIEVARLMIKDILDQLNKQQQDQDDQQKQPDQQDQQQSEQQEDSDSQQQQNQGQDPNDPQDPNQAQGQRGEPNEPSDPNESQGRQDQQQPSEQEQQQAVVPDATAQEILDKERRQKEQRRMLRRGRSPKVEKDW